MRIEIYDSRTEHRDVLARIDQDGNPLPDKEPSWYGGTHPNGANHDTRATHDTREVEIWFEDGDLEEHGVPSQLDTGHYQHHGRQTFPFRLRHGYITYRRDNTPPPEKNSYNPHYAGPQWKRVRFQISGPNLRKDGSTGEKPQSLAFPTKTYRDTGKVYGEDSVTVAPDHHRYKSQLERVGKPVMDWLSDPIPEWLAAIEARVNPKTGEPFTHPDEHRFGVFS